MHIRVKMHQDGDTPLKVSAVKGHLPVVEYLVEKGADVEVKDQVSGIIIVVKPHELSIWSVNVSSMDPLHWFMLRGKVIYQ